MSSMNRSIDPRFLLCPEFLTPSLSLALSLGLARRRPPPNTTDAAAARHHRRGRRSLPPAHGSPPPSPCSSRSCSRSSPAPLDARGAVPVAARLPPFRKQQDLRRPSHLQHRLLCLLHHRQSGTPSSWLHTALLLLSFTDNATWTGAECRFEGTFEEAAARAEKEECVRQRDEVQNSFFTWHPFGANSSRGFVAAGSRIFSATNADK